MVACTDEKRFTEISIPVRAVLGQEFECFGNGVRMCNPSGITDDCADRKEGSPVTGPESSRNSCRAAHASVVRSAAGSPTRTASCGHISPAKRSPERWRTASGQLPFPTRRAAKWPRA